MPTNNNFPNWKGDSNEVRRRYAFQSSDKLNKLIKKRKRSKHLPIKHLLQNKFPECYHHAQRHLTNLRTLTSVQLAAIAM